jgi:hypothetical protein
LTNQQEIEEYESYSGSNADPLMEFLMHYGTPRHSGRYPWGTGDNPQQHNRNFLSYVSDMRKQGMSDNDIAKGLDLNSTQFRAANSIAKNEVRNDQIRQVNTLSDKGMSNTAIAERMGIGESQVRALRKPATQLRNDQLVKTADFLKKEIDDKKYIDVGAGAEYYAGGVSRTKFDNAISMLEQQGYRKHYVNIEQLGTGNQTKLKVLTKDDVTPSEVYHNRGQIRLAGGFKDDDGTTIHHIEPPVAVNAKRIAVRYGNEGGDLKDGVIELRRGVDDISLGAARYAQVRISVNGTHYLKGMAMYSDDLPDGVDMRFNTNKKSTGNHLDAMKPIKDDPESPFGAIVRQKYYTDANGNRKLSPINIVGAVNPHNPGEKTPGEEGGWAQWSKSLSSQMLSKQQAPLIKTQLGLALKDKQAEYDEIMALTNPAVKKRLLESFADDADSSAVHLKAHAMSRQGTHVILPINSLKDNEIYAPRYENGEKVVLVRYPHGGIFEIPELTVNNRNREANRLMKDAADAVGIHANVAKRLSGADFDGDTVLVIPNTHGHIKTAPALEGLKDFDPQIYKVPKEERITISPRTKQLKMGDVSNLITDMTVLGAPHNEIARAVRHSMVVIDSEKHNLDWKESAKKENISELKAKYQGSSRAGAATLISRASGKKVINERKLRPAGEGGNIDPATGKKMYVETGNSYIRPATTKIGKNGNIIQVPEKVIFKKTTTTKMDVTDDAYSLISKDGGTLKEHIYASHANSLKALGNQARKSYLETPSMKVNPSARAAYRPEVDSLKAKLNIAKKNAPLERQAQVIANAMVDARRAQDKTMDAATLKKLKGVELNKARTNLGARKERVEITPDEWKAIQSGAISHNFLTEILKNTDLDKVKQLATPRAIEGMSPTQLSRARAMQAAGHTQGEIASALGVSTTKLADGLKGG